MSTPARSVSPTKCTKLIALGNIFLSIYGIVLFFYCFSQSDVFNHLYLLAAFFAIFSTFGGLCGLLRSTPSIMWCAMVSIAVCYGYLIVGGLCILFSSHINSEIKSFQTIQYGLTVATINLDEIEKRNKSNLIISGVSILLLGLYSGALGRHTCQLLGDKRGSVALLQTFSVCMLPFSIVLLVGGHYIVDTHILTTASHTGMFMFICGMLLFLLLLFSFIGSSFEFRRMLQMFSACVLLLGIVFIGGAVFTYILEASVANYIISNWESVRIVLAPTLQAKYDKTQFISFVQVNLKAIAYITLLSGIFLLIQGFAASILRNIITTSKTQLQDDKNYLKSIDAKAEFDENGIYRSGISSHPHFTLRRRWHTYFKQSKRKQRIAMRCLCGICGAFLFIILTLMTVSIIFANQCSSVTKPERRKSIQILKSSSDVGFKTYSFSNMYKIGLTKITQGNSTLGTVNFQQYALKTAYINNNLQEKIFQEKFQLIANPSASSKLLWLELSCQEAILDIQLPSLSNKSLSRSIEIISTVGIDVNLRDANGNVGLTHMLNISASKSNIVINGIYIGVGGVLLESSAGKITMYEAVIDGSGILGSNTKTVIKSSLGYIDIQNVSLKDSELIAQSRVSQVTLSNIKSSVTYGRSTIKATSESGGIYAKNLKSDWIKFKSSSGTVIADNIAAQGSNAFLGRIEVETVGGSISASNVESSGYINIESHTGNIRIHLKSYTFKGYYYLRSETGEIEVEKGKYSYDSFNETKSRDIHEKTGVINCGTSDTSNCYFVGDINIRSYSGDIKLVIGCTDKDCE